MEPYAISQPMLVARNDALVAARTLAEQLIKAARAVHDATPPLGSLDEEGRVVNRAIRALKFQRDGLLNSFNALALVVGRDYYDLLKYKHKYAAVDGLRFHSDESWAEKCSHLDREIIRLQKLVDEGKDNI